MTILATTAPFPFYADLDGSPLDGGSLYFGTANLNPKTSPVTVYWDAAGTQPAAQPIRTDQGFTVRNGTPAIVYINGDYSLTVEDRKGRLLYYAPTTTASNNAAIVQANLDAYIALIASSSGSSQVGFQQAGSGTVAITEQAEMRSRAVTPQQFGAVGDGVADDTVALNLFGASGKAGYIPYTTGGYKITASVTFSSDVTCDGTIYPTTAVGATPAVIIASSGYGVKRKIRGVNVFGGVAVRAAGVTGIRVDCENAHLTDCTAGQLGYGIVVRMYSVTLDKCSAWQCNTNLSAYARDSSHEINALTIIGGNYDSAVDYAMNIGDTRWGDAMAASGSHGVVVSILGGTNTDGAVTKIDSVSCVEIDNFYCEGTNTNTCIQLGGAGDGYVRNAVIRNCFFKSAQYAIRCNSAVNGLRVKRNFYTGITHSALYLTSDLYPYSYETGDSTASYTTGQEVHTGFRSLALSSVSFVNATLPGQGLYAGVQTAVADPGVWYPGGVLQDSTPTVKRMNASTAGRFYTSPVSGIAGTVSGSTFTFTTPSQCGSFNGGDRIVTVPAGATYVRSVDYEAGTMVIDGGVTATGAATVSQTTASFHSTTVTYSTAAPISGLWERGDVAMNGVAAVGQPKGWQCTVRGTPGTWNSLGNL